ncbi:MAG: type I 3-dehydroquinate dehydratase [Anaerovoracaceae bacterium]|nr:type I 3-dehydroquinate dehydratase [Anaerovoracaceae bacterium]
MSNIVEVNGLKIGEGMPKICIPVVAENIEEIKKQAGRIMFTPADIVEWRVDHLKKGDDIPSVLVALDKLRQYLSEKPVLFTFRTAAEGGKKAVSAEKYVELYEAVIESGKAELVDIELMLGDDVVGRLVKKAHENGVRTVLSNHDFNATPPVEVMTERLMKMKALGADIAKIAVMPENSGDVLSLFAASENMKRMEDAIPVITISMGPTGLISRIAGETFGSAVTFASAGKASAPGQIDADELDAVLNTIHHAMGEPQCGGTGVCCGETETAGKRDNVILIGFMGTGKTTVARRIAEKTGYDIKEMDEMIENDMGMSVAQIFQDYGEPYFRDLESDMAQRVAASERVVISCGGGTVLRQKNVDALRSSGSIVLLRAKPETVLERVKKNGDKRPLLSRYQSRGYISWLMKKRSDIYADAADYIINVDGRTADDIADEIIEYTGIGGSDQRRV